MKRFLIQISLYQYEQEISRNSPSSKRISKSKEEWEGKMKEIKRRTVVREKNARPCAQLSQQIDESKRKIKENELNAN